MASERALYVKPEDNIIIGSQYIMAYLGIRSIVTLYNWVEVYGLPAIKRPDGSWMTSMTAIDQWIFMGAELDAQNRLYSRGANTRVDIALEQAQRRKKRAELGKMRDGPLKHNNPYGEEDPLDSGEW